MAEGKRGEEGRTDSGYRCVRSIKDSFVSLKSEFIDYTSGIRWSSLLKTVRKGGGSQESKNTNLVTRDIKKS